MFPVVTSVPLPGLAYIRRYSATTRPWFQFHYDACRVTMNIALDDDESHCGGHLLAIIDDGPGPPVEAQPKLRRLKRSLGSAVLHGCQVPHAVTRMFSGVRFALILFFGRPCPKPELDAAFVCSYASSNGLVPTQHTASNLLARGRALPLRWLRLQRRRSRRGGMLPLRRRMRI